MTITLKDEEVIEMIKERMKSSLYPFQEEILKQMRDGKRKVIANMGRNVGKSYIKEVLKEKGVK